MLHMCALANQKLVETGLMAPPSLATKQEALASQIENEAITYREIGCIPDFSKDPITFEMDDTEMMVSCPIYPFQANFCSFLQIGEIFVNEQNRISMQWRNEIMSEGENCCRSV